MPMLAASAITYALSEAIGRMACLSFGCCYGKPVREASPRMARVFARFPLVFHGRTKKAAYASGLADEPLIPVQTDYVTGIYGGGTGGVGFVSGRTMADRGFVPVLATWGWRALSESLRADYRGDSRISAYQVMALIAMAYLAAMLTVIPSEGPRAEPGGGADAADLGKRDCASAVDVGGPISLLRKKPGDGLGGVVPRGSGKSLGIDTKNAGPRRLPGLHSCCGGKVEKLSAEAGSHGLHHGAVRVVIFQSPCEGSAQSSWSSDLNVSHLQACGGRIVEGPEGLGRRVVDGNSHPAPVECLSKSRKALQSVVSSNAIGRKGIAGGGRCGTGRGLI